MAQVPKPGSGQRLRNKHAVPVWSAAGQPFTDTIKRPRSALANGKVSFVAPARPTTDPDTADTPAPPPMAANSDGAAAHDAQAPIARMITPAAASALGLTAPAPATLNGKADVRFVFLKGAAAAARPHSAGPAYRGSVLDTVSASSESHPAGSAGVTSEPSAVLAAPTNLPPRPHAGAGTRLASLPPEVRRPRSAASCMAADRAADERREAALPSFAGARPDTAQDVLIRLREGMAGLEATGTVDRVAKLALHRRCFTDYVHSPAVQRDTAAVTLLEAILAEYDALQFQRLDRELDGMMARVHAAEDAREEEKRVAGVHLRKISELELTVANMRRELTARQEVLAQLAQTYRINVSNINWITGDMSGKGGKGKGKSAAAEEGPEGLTMADIRQVTSNLENKYILSDRGAAGVLEAEEQEESRRMAQADADLPADPAQLAGVDAHIVLARQQQPIPPNSLSLAAPQTGPPRGRRRSTALSFDADEEAADESGSPLVVATRDGRLPQTKLQLLRNCQRVENGGVDLTASVDDDDTVAPL